MEKMSPEIFRDHFGENTAIAALAVIVEAEEKDKKRLTHDATHGVRVNRRIKCRGPAKRSSCSWRRWIGRRDPSR